MKNSLERRILIFSLLALTLTIAVNTGFNLENFRHTYRDSILQRAGIFASILKADIEGAVKLGSPLHAIDGLAERCREIVLKDPEISYCLVENSSGSVLYHSDGDYPDIASVSYSGLLATDVSILESSVMGKVYDYAAPIYDAKNKATGLIRIGFRDEALDKLTMDHLGSTIALFAAVFVAAFALIVIFARYDLVLPVRRLCGMAEELAAGKFNVETPDLRTRELAMLGTTLAGLAKSLRERDEKLSRNYQEVEQTNLELQRSYENLESLSSDLGRSREMYRALLDDASDAILVCNDDDALVIVNKAAENFFGLPKTVMVRKNYFSFLEMIQCRDLELQFERHQAAQPGHSSKTEIRFWREADQQSVLGRATTSVVIDKVGRRMVQIIVRDETMV
jgi:PAS domain S-box-containing protein